MARRSLSTLHVALVRVQYGWLGAERPRATRSRRTDRGATAVEYGLIVALIAVVIIAAVAFFGTSISRMFNHSATAIPTN